MFSIVDAPIYIPTHSPTFILSEQERCREAQSSNILFSELDAQTTHFFFF